MPALRILVLSEDGNDDTHTAISGLARHMLKIVVEGIDTRPEKIQFDRAHGQVRQAAKINRWRSEAEDDEPAIRALMTAIVTQLLQTDEDGNPVGFVFHHHDTDEPFEHAERSLLRRQWRAFHGRIRDQIRARRAGAPEPEIDQIMARMIEIDPSTCIESWTYQHTEVASKLCQSGCGKHTAILESWAQDRNLLDEIPRPADHLDCSKIGKNHNLDLVGAGYPAQAVWDAGKSFYEVTCRMAASGDLVAALERTW